MNHIAKNKKLAVDRIYSVLKRGPKRGLTARQIAIRAELAESTVSGLLSSMDVATIGTLNTGMRGRPAKLYAL